MALIKCVDCGKEISDKAKECIHCGCPISASLPKTVKCPECGKELPVQAASCVHCGYPISPSTQKPSGPVDLKNAFGDFFKSGPDHILSVDFNAVLCGHENGQTQQRVYVPALGCEFTFLAPNNMKVGQGIQVKINDGQYSHIRFNAVSVSRQSSSAPAAAPASPSANGAVNSAAIQRIKSYKPNAMVTFLHSRAFYALVFIFAAGIVCSFDGGLDMALPALALFGGFILLLILNAVFYPIYHIRKYFRKNNIEAAICNDSGYINTAISAYNLMPRRSMLKYIKSLNPQAAQKIEQQLAARKKKK